MDNKRVGETILKDLSSFMIGFERDLEGLACLINRNAGSSINTTNQISNYVEAKAERVCLHVEKEVFIGIERSGVRKTGRKYVQRARIDYMLTFLDGAKLAIEIDQKNKAWSLKKLAHCVSDDDCFGMWIRWKGEMQKVFRQNTSKICMVDITTIFPEISTIGKKWMEGGTT